MLNEHVNLIADGARQSLLSWTSADAALESWVFVNGVKLYGPLLLDTLERFVNGVKLYGPLLLDTLERSVPVPLATGECLSVEVHDMPPEEIATPVFETPTTTPTLQWNPLPGAQRYRLYHREGNPVELNGSGGVWHFLRVEAVDEYGNESTRRAWRCFAVEPPGLPSRIEIADGTSPGLFEITVNP